MTKFTNAVEEIYSDVSQNKSKLQLSKIKKLFGISTTIKAVSDRDTTVNTNCPGTKDEVMVKTSNSCFQSPATA